MSRPRWKLTDLMVLVLACGLAFGAHRYFWQPPPDPNARPNLAAYLALLSVATLGSFFARPEWRRPSQGYALFNWCNLAFVLWGGFGLSTIHDSQRIVEGTKMGVAIGVITALVAAWLLEPPSRPGDAS